MTLRQLPRWVLPIWALALLLWAFGMKLPGSEEQEGLALPTLTYNEGAKGVFDPSASAAASGCEVDEPLLPAAEHTRRDDVSELKVRLFQLGEFYGRFDDLYDQQAQASVRSFQKRVGLAPTGVVDEATWRALGAGEDPQPITSSAVRNEPPPEGERSIVIDTHKLTLTLSVNGQPYKTYPIAVGRSHEGKFTPTGEWRVVHRSTGWGGGFGTRWLGLNVPWGIYGIHGTNKPWSIGRRASAGCIRMHNRHVEELYPLVPMGTPVKIVGLVQPVHFRKEVKPGTSGRDIVLTQLAVKEMGFPFGDADGRYGGKSEQAVRTLQSQFGIPVDGRIWADVYYLIGIRNR